MSSVRTGFDGEASKKTSYSIFTAAAAVDSRRSRYNLFNCGGGVVVEPLDVDLQRRAAEADFLFVSDAGCCFVEAVPPSRFGAATECGEIEAMPFSAAVPAPLQICMLDGEID